MPNGHAVELPQPRDEQVFEDFCCDLFQAHWGVSAQKYGRRGQAQKGVDIYAQVDGCWVGIQCKKKEPGKNLTAAEIGREVKKARRFKPALSKLIFATTAPRHNKAQDKVMAINDGAPGVSFQVEIKFWDVLVEMLRNHPQIYDRWRRRLSLGAGPEIYDGRLPASKNAELIGRKKELTKLEALAG